jgi:hypothetical protein
MRRRKIPPDEVIVNYEAKLAAGGTGSGSGRGRGSGSGSGGGPGGYRPGQNVICKVMKPEPGGYSVIIVKNNFWGYLPSNARHNVGDDVLATFVCFDKNRMLLCERFTHGKGDLVERNYGVDWESILNESQENESEVIAAPPEPREKKELECAIDLIMPPIKADTLKVLRVQDYYDVDWLITQWEGGMHTGCIKTSSANLSSNSAMLLYKGRAVGCIHCKSNSEAKSTEAALNAMLADLDAPDTVVTIYDLPDEITIAMSALFLGYPVERHDDYSAKEYLDYICSWLKQKNGTATLAISDSQNSNTCLCFIYEGNVVGAFDVKRQSFQEGRALVEEFIENDPEAILEVSIIPSDMYNRAKCFGFSLSMSRIRSAH